MIIFPRECFHLPASFNRDAVSFTNTSLVGLKSDNDPPFCDCCKAFGRIDGNRICPQCLGTGFV